jgi:hypothetical protein
MHVSVPAGFQPAAELVGVRGSLGGCATAVVKSGRYT